MDNGGRGVPRPHTGRKEGMEDENDDDERVSVTRHESEKD